MTVELTWTHEERPQWDGTGTIAECWYATLSAPDEARIDRFFDEDGGGYAYTVNYHGCPVAHGENEAAESFEAAEAAVIALLAL